MNNVIRRLSAKNGIICHSLLRNIARTTSSTSTKSEVKDVNVDEKSSVGNLKTKISVDEKFQKVFHYPHVIKVVFYQRFKIYLTGSTFLLTSIVASRGIDSLPGTISTIFGLASFSTFALLISGEFLRRVIGIIYIDKTDFKTVKISHMNFWGKRKDILVDIDDIKYFSDTRNTGNPSQNVYWKVQFYDPKLSTMFISTRYGGIEDPETFRLIFGGKALE